MNKRSAVLVAAGLVVALVAGGLALGYGIVGPSPTTAVASSATHQQQKPRVRTVTKKIKVHRKAGAGNTVTSASGVASVSGPASSSSSWSDDDSFDNHDEGWHSEDEGEHGDD